MDIAHLALASTSAAVDADTPLYRSLAVKDDCGRNYALWLVRPVLVARMDDKWRFFDNVRRVRDLRLPGVARVIDFGVYGGYDYVLLARSPISLSDPSAIAGEAAVVGVARCLAHTLDVLRLSEIVHGFLSPADVTLIEGDPILLGAGFWGRLDGQLLRAACGRGGETFAPEVLRGDPATARSDIYSMAILLARLVLGDPLLTPASALAGRDLSELPALRAALDSRPEGRPGDLWPLVDELTARLAVGQGELGDVVELWAEEPYDPDTTPTTPVDMRPVLEAARLLEAAGQAQTRGPV